MKGQPAFSAKTANPACGGSNREGNQQNKSGEPAGDEGTLDDVFKHARNIEKSEEPKHATKTNEFGQMENLAERCDAESKNQKAQGPIAGLMLQKFDGIRCQVLAIGAQRAIEERQEREGENCDFRPLGGQEFSDGIMHYGG